MSSAGSAMLINALLKVGSLKFGWKLYQLKTAGFRVEIDVACLSCRRQGKDSRLPKDKESVRAVAVPDNSW
jgi:hypothetical protein